MCLVWACGMCIIRKGTLCWATRDWRRNANSQCAERDNTVKKLHIYVDTSVIGGCEDEEFSAVTRQLWSRFRAGECVMVVSDLTMQEIEGAPQAVRKHLEDIPAGYQMQVRLSGEAQELADAYLARGVVGPGSLADALHVALATVSRNMVRVIWVR